MDVNFIIFLFKIEKELNKGKDIVPIGKTKEQHTVSNDI